MGNTITQWGPLVDKTGITLTSTETHKDVNTEDVFTKRVCKHRPQIDLIVSLFESHSSFLITFNSQLANF